MEFLQVVFFLILILQGIYTILFVGKKLRKPEEDVDVPQIQRKVLKIPSNKYLVRYILNTFIKDLDEMRSPAFFLQKHVYFEDKKKLEFDSDADSIVNKLYNDLIDNKKSVSVENLTYIQTKSKNKKKKFKNKFNVSEYPTPLVMFENPKILFGFIDVY